MASRYIYQKKISKYQNLLNPSCGFLSIVGKKKVKNNHLYIIFFHKSLGNVGCVEYRTSYPFSLFFLTLSYLILYLY